MRELKGQKIVVYDLEIIHPIDGREITWTSFDKMGISVGASYDYRDGDTRVFLKDNLGELIDQMHSADLIVGFNHIGFDNNLLRGSGFKLFPDVDLPNYDILVESRKGLGWKPGDFFPRGCKLDNHLEAMFGKESMKTGHGELAPVLWQQGKIGSVISYCIADVKRSCMVFENIWHHGWVKTLLHGQKTVSDPLNFFKKP